MICMYRFILNYISVAYRNVLFLTLFKEVIRARGAEPKRYITSSDGDVHLGLADREKRLSP